MPLFLSHLPWPGLLPSTGLRITAQLSPPARHTSHAFATCRGGGWLPPFAAVRYRSRYRVARFVVAPAYRLLRARGLGRPGEFHPRAPVAVAPAQLRACDYTELPCLAGTACSIRCVRCASGWRPDTRVAKSGGYPWRRFHFLPDASPCQRGLGSLFYLVTHPRRCFMFCYIPHSCAPPLYRLYFVTS